MDRVPGAGATLHVAHGGTGPTVVLLHGFPQHHLAWREVARRLAPSCRVVRWAPKLSTRVLAGGHFLPEDAPDELAAAIQQLCVTADATERPVR